MLHSDLYAFLLHSKSIAIVQMPILLPSWHFTSVPLFFAYYNFTKKKKNACHAGKSRICCETKLSAYIFTGEKLSSNVSFHSVLIMGLRWNEGFWLWLEIVSSKLKFAFEISLGKVMTLST